jgi:hypothetical protein
MVSIPTQADKCCKRAYWFPMNLPIVSNRTMVYFFGWNGVKCYGILRGVSRRGVFSVIMRLLVIGVSKFWNEGLFTPFTFDLHYLPLFLEKCLDCRENADGCLGVQFFYCRRNRRNKDCLPFLDFPFRASTAAKRTRVYFFQWNGVKCREILRGVLFAEISYFLHRRTLHRGRLHTCVCSLRLCKVR